MYLEGGGGGFFSCEDADLMLQPLWLEEYAFGFGVSVSEGLGLLASGPELLTSV